MIINRLKDKNVLITDASSGIGLATAHQFAKMQANLILVSRQEEELTKIQEELENQYKVRVLTYVLDVTNRKQIDRFVDIILNDLNINILINNAGLALGLEPIMDGSAEDWDIMIDTNVRGLIYMAKVTLANMVKQNSGHIINISSIAAKYPYANGAVYCASKSAVSAFSHALREECIANNIRVSEIMPGIVKTNFSNIRFKGDKMRANDVYSNKNFLTAEDVAELITYTANLADHINLAQSLIIPTTQFIK